MVKSDAVEILRSAGIPLERNAVCTYIQILPMTTDWSRQFLLVCYNDAPELVCSLVYLVN